MTISADDARALLDAASIKGTLSYRIYEDDAEWPSVISETLPDGFTLHVADVSWSTRTQARSELFAAAPDLAATVIELWERIDKVLALHRKTTEELLGNKCANEVCDHEEDECPSIYVDVCGCCAEIAQQVSDEYWPAAMDEITWPCPTVAALTQGGEQS